METKFKVGDKVLLNKPKYKYNNAIIWQKEMERYVGDIFEVVSVNADSKLYYCDGEYINYWLCESWLTKVGEGIITEEPKAKETKPIDWEARRWNLASKIFAETEDITLDSAVRQAEIFIKYYKQTLK